MSSLINETIQRKRIFAIDRG